MTTLPEPPSKPPRIRVVLALVVLFGVHTFQAVRLFPTLGSIVEPSSPILVVDHAIHEYHGALGARFARESGTSWGYDPYFMAGYPETPIWDSSSNTSIFFNLIGGGSETNFRPYKVGLFVSSILLLVAIAGGARAAGLGWSEVAIASALGWFYFWVGFPIALWRSGLFSFILASAGVGLLLGLCSRFDRHSGRGGWLALVTVGTGLFFVHVTAPILALGGLLAFWAVVARRHGWRWNLAILGSGMLAVVLNLTWLVPLWRFRHIRTGSSLFMTTNSGWYLLGYFLERSTEGRCALVLLIFGAMGLVAWWVRGLRGQASAFGGSILALIVLTGFGSLWEPTKNLEPLRFRVAFNFLLAVPAASALTGISGALARWLGGGWRGMIAGGLIWVAPLGAWAAIERDFFASSGAMLTYRRPLVVGYRPEMRAMADWLKANTDLSARILFEDQLRLMERTDPESVHWTPMLPSMLRPESRMFIGGLYQTAFIRHHEMAAFGDFRLGNRPIDEWSPALVDRYCRTYNIGWVVCWSPLSRFWFDRFEPATRVATLPRYSSPDLPPSTNEHEIAAMVRRAGISVARRYMLEGERSYAIYRLELPHSYFLKGRGRVVAVEPNRIELADIEPDGGAAILSLHWLDGWRSEPPVTLRSEPAPPDPVDFVRIETSKPIPRLILDNGGRSP